MIHALNKPLRCTLRPHIVQRLGCNREQGRRDPFLLDENLTVSKWAEPSSPQTPEGPAANLAEPILGGQAGVWECLQEEVMLKLRP